MENKYKETTDKDFIIKTDSKMEFFYKYIFFPIMMGIGGFLWIKVLLN